MCSAYTSREEQRCVVDKINKDRAMSIEQVIKLRGKAEKYIAAKKFDEAQREIRVAIGYVRENGLNCLICDKANNDAEVVQHFPSACVCKRKKNQEKIAKEITCLIYSQGRCDIENATTADEHLKVAILFANELVPWIRAINSQKTARKRWKFVSFFLWKRVACACLPKARTDTDFADVSLLAAELALSWEVHDDNFKIGSHLTLTLNDIWRMVANPNPNPNPNPIFFI